MLVTLERLQHGDIGLLRALRNAESDHFFTSHYITAEEQEDWWWRYQFDLTIQFYTIWLNAVTPVGFVSVYEYQVLETFFDVRELGHILLAPAHRGRGIMHRALTEVRRLYDPFTFWVAHVKAGNEASLALFAKQEFVQFDPTPNRRSKQCVSRKPTSTKPSLSTSVLTLAAKSSPTK